ncbi:Asp-tRNA(Asn)/Glu-tRNA(Gln) amidotransferase subunit GatA [Bdellovibrio sp. SKB1291214]|uniref:Asp-tRNA(Asn)/Glu-tRNA(Gln) amidotransferase subunit GatA n=1 Tax=Bdellovibrio sp. SKB1291214 TaxID=1732569 RepID=UPI000B5188EC|nr:Asp-tRNA(Asn)/Glu-tRNA(Gln) amidotransferase subunit GatA [Bdellovibrio sp. SKB1291214]UYL10497.1 Asp-tRNA(Asn)/Glu-tRNA(Gln) amidotransferase subunit GatA [Bdellovibrio sp. SKB1291214]
MELTFASISDISEAVKTKKISAKEVADHFQKRIGSLDKQLNSFTSINPDSLKQAEALDDRIAKGEDVGLLAGVPFGIKEMLCTKNLTTTAGSKILSNFVPPYDATVVARLKKNGATIMGKLNQDEFAMGSSNETSYHGSVKNPWDTSRVPGGSSGGSAAAQAARLVVGTIGTDTGGSIRQPASFCGIVGVKPTYGRVSRYGIIAFASSLDQAGPMVSTVKDAALTLEVISGHDPMDSTSSQKTVPQWSKNLSQDVKGFKVGVIKEYLKGGLDADTEKTFNDSLEALKTLGAEIVEVSVSMTEFAVPIYYLIATSEASSNLARYDGIRYGYRAEFASLSGVELEDFYGKTRGEGFGSEVKRRIMLGTYCLSSGYYDAYYNKAGQVRRLLTEQYLAAFKKCDVILSPVTTAPAFKIGELISDPLAMYMNDIFTTSTNLAGLPGMSVPYSLSKSGLPIGIQVTANHFDEQRMLNVAAALEASSLMKGQKPHVI